MPSSLTPIRIRRSKRKRAPEEQWKAQKRPRSRLATPRLIASGSQKSNPGESSDGNSYQRKRKRRALEQSKLEQLPAEIIQSIFEMSNNLHLALASQSLHRQLSSEHLQLQLTSHILDKVLDCAGVKAEDKDLANATRLLNSRFMTWNFFRRWLHERARGIASAEEHERQDHAALWTALHPSDGLLPPPKLLHGPWTAERVNFLRVLAANVQDIAFNSLYQADLVHEGLVQAISERAVDAVHLLLEFNLVCSQELLRQAVIDCGCNREIVEMLLQRTGHDEQYDSHVQRWVRRSTLDILDPMLWAWIERAEKEGNLQGTWLKGVLQNSNTSIT